jgi:hypothetical protein
MVYMSILHFKKVTEYYFLCYIYTSAGADPFLSAPAPVKLIGSGRLWLR